jgi:uncharacterized protein (TIGR01777 family)
MSAKKRILITGASGMIAGKLAEQLLTAGFDVIAMSRSVVRDARFAASYQWQPEKNQFDPRALEGVVAVVHLAGAGIADEKWTAQRKREILESRTQSTAFLAEQLRILPHTISTVVAASATGFYGDTADRLVTENDAAGTGFLAETCIAWEQSLQRLKTDTTRLVILRIGFVIDRKDGALPVMARPVRLFAGAPYGNGRQFISWIDSHDLAKLFQYAITNPSLTGTYNAVAPYPVHNKDFIKALGKALHRPIWPIAVPSIIFKMLLGEQSALVLQGQHVSAEKTLATGFRFDFPALESSLQHHLI